MRVRCLRVLVPQLKPTDRLSLVLMTTQATVLQPLTLVRDIDMEDVRKKVERVRPGGGTRLMAGMQEASVQFDRYLATQAHATAPSVSAASSSATVSSSSSASMSSASSASSSSTSSSSSSSGEEDDRDMEDEQGDITISGPGLSNLAQVCLATEMPRHERERVM